MPDVDTGSLDLARADMQRSHLQTFLVSGEDSRMSLDASLIRRLTFKWRSRI